MDELESLPYTGIGISMYNSDSPRGRGKLDMDKNEEDMPRRQTDTASGSVCGHDAHTCSLLKVAAHFLDVAAHHRLV